MNDTNTKTFLEMSNMELFCVLTGDRGMMAQMALQEVVKDFMKKYPGREESLSEMVRIIAEEE